MLYLISYDLRSPGQNYQKLYDHLASIRATRVLESVWLVADITGQAKPIADAVLRLIDANDRLLVAEVTSDTAWYNLLITKEAMSALMRNART